MSARVASMVAATACLTLVLAAQAAAAPPPAPVSAVTVRGTSTPSQVAITWTNPADPTYASARVVIVPGDGAATDPSDPRAVTIADVAAPGTSYTWSAGAAGSAFSVSVFAFNADRSAASPPATALVALPAAVRRLFLSRSVRGSTLTAHLVLPAYADAAVLCRGDTIGAPPTSPSGAVECSTPSAQPSLAPAPGLGLVTVFGVDTKNGIYGPSSPAASALPPPSTPDDLALGRVDATRLDAMWSYREPLDGGTGMGTGGNVRYELTWVAGTRSPVGNAAAHQVTIPVNPLALPIQSVTRRVTGLVPDLPYTFAVRGVDSDGNTSAWTPPVTGVTSAPGDFVLDNSARGVWRTSRLPVPAGAFVRASAVGPDGTLDVGVYRDVAPKVLHYFRRPGGVWRRGAFPAGLRNPLVLEASPSAPGVLAVSDHACVFVRSHAGVWTTRGCFRAPIRGVHHPVPLINLKLDRRGALHALYADEAGRANYATDSSGRWTVRRLPSPAGTTPFGISMSYDRVSDKLVVAEGRLNAAGERFTMTVLTKPARSGGFTALRRAFSVAATQAVNPVSVTSYADRITIAALSTPDNIYGPVAGPPVLFTADRAGIIGGPAVIPGIRTNDRLVQVAAQSAGRAVVSWTHQGFSTNEQGLWTAVRTYRGMGSASMSRPTRRTRSPDQLRAVSLDARGNLYIFINR